ncbi:hypothetical protein EI94DRAFT_1707627 [Lactarius quietus]|nr:hypothetical protein EI94DRAFT_1707627 [Lactarius quietus]
MQLSLPPSNHGAPLKLALSSLVQRVRAVIMSGSEISPVRFDFDTPSQLRNTVPKVIMSSSLLVPSLTSSTVAVMHQDTHDFLNYVLNNTVNEMQYDKYHISNDARSLLRLLSVLRNGGIQMGVPAAVPPHKNYSSN